MAEVSRLMAGGCKECGSIPGELHKPGCSRASMRQPNRGPGSTPSTKERRAIAAEKAAEALMHLATAHVDGMRAFEALCRAMLPLAEAVARGLEEERANRERRKR